MYLGPHHFQVQSRYFEDSIQFAASALQFETYGFVGFGLDAEALRNGTLSLLHARAGVAGSRNDVHSHWPEERQGSRAFRQLQINIRVESTWHDQIRAEGNKTKNTFTKPLKADFKELFKALSKGIGHIAIGKWEEVGADTVEALSAIGLSHRPRGACVSSHTPLHCQSTV